jgi:hypothetical protein
MDELDFDLLTASLRADAGDLKAFAEALAVKLEQSLPGRTRVERRGDGLFARTKRVRGIAVDTGEVVYRLEVDGALLEPCRLREVRGIVLKTEPLSLDEWIVELSRELTALAATSERERQALQRMLEG